MAVQIFGMFVNLVFLGQAFTIMLVYIWSRRNPNVRMNFFGLLNFQAPFLPWVLMGFSLLLGNSIIVDLLGRNLCGFIRFINLSCADTCIDNKFVKFCSLLFVILIWWNEFFNNNELICCWYLYVLSFHLRHRSGTCVLLFGGCVPNQPGGGRWLRTPSILWVLMSHVFTMSRGFYVFKANGVYTTIQKIYFFNKWML